MGVQPESAIREMLDRYVDATGTPEVTAAPAPSQRPEDLAEHLLERRDAVGAAAAIEQLAAANAEHPGLKSLRARLKFVETANANPDVASLRSALEADPSNAAARHALAAHHAVVGDFGTALAEWLEVMRHDRRLADDLGRRSLLQAFDVLGADDPLVAQYRRRMASLLH
jgi:putative thioredoxin